jgi:Tfp pilus assembly protein PilO
MSAINLFWQLDISDTTKYLLIFLIIVCIFLTCYMNKNKNKNIIKNKSLKQENTPLKDEYYSNYMKQKNLTQCHKRYMNCVENNMENGTDEFCYPCINNGKKQDFFYDPVSKEWLSSK